MWKGYGTWHDSSTKHHKKMSEVNNNESGNIMGVLSGQESLKGEIRVERSSIWITAAAVVATAVTILILKKIFK